jgi:hypothetical protein
MCEVFLCKQHMDLVVYDRWIACKAFLQVKHLKHFVRESKVHRIVPYLINQPFRWTYFLMTFDHKQQIYARNKEHASQSIENMQAKEHQDSLSLIYWLSGERNYNSRIIELGGHDCSNHVVPFNVGRSWLSVPPPHYLLLHLFLHTFRQRWDTWI